MNNNRLSAISYQLSALTVVLAMGVTAGIASAQESGIETGMMAPSAAVETLDGKAADLSRYIGKKPALIEFWATWCSSCKQLEPQIKSLHAKYGKQIAFVGVAVSVNQSPALAKRYVARHGMPGDQYYDRRGNATGAYDVPATSYIVIIDRTGKVVYTGLGGDQKLEGAVRKAVE